MNEAQFFTRKRRSDAGRLQVTERDVYALRWITEQYTIHTGHLAILLGQHAKAATKAPNCVTPSAMRHALERWQKLELIEQPSKLVSYNPAYVWISRHAIREFAFPFPYYQPRLRSLPQIANMNAIRLMVQEQDPNATWLSERTLHNARRDTPIDAELHTSTGQIIAVKVVDSPQEVTTFTASIQFLLAHKSGLWCYCSAHLFQLLQQATATFNQAQCQRITIKEIPTLSTLSHNWSGAPEYTPGADSLTA